MTRLLLELLAATAAVWLGFELQRLRPVWKGERVKGLPRRSTRFPEVNRRNFVAYVVFLAGTVSWFALIVEVGRFPVAARPLLVWVSVGLVVIGLLGFVSMLTITFLNRPRKLVPPALRDHPGKLVKRRRDSGSGSG